MIVISSTALLGSCLIILPVIMSFPAALCGFIFLISSAVSRGLRTLIRNDIREGMLRKSSMSSFTLLVSGPCGVNTWARCTANVSVYPAGIVYNFSGLRKRKFSYNI